MVTAAPEIAPAVVVPGEVSSKRLKNNAEPSDRAAAAPSRAEVFAVFARLAPPRRHLRLDAMGTHEFKGSITWQEVQLRCPAQPFAAPLASDKTRLFKLLCFDLDAHALDADAVQEDLLNLLELLSEAEVPYLVVRSGPGGGYHVWVAVGGRGAPAARVKALAKALSGMFPTLDANMLRNAKTGCARVPGSPHRAGGLAEIDAYYHRGDARGALAAFGAGGQEDAVERIWNQLPAETRQQAAPGKPANRPVGTGDDGYDRLDRPWRQLSPAVAALADRSVEPDEDTSSRLRSLTLGCAFAGWSYTEYERLCETSPAAVHARTLRDPKGRGGRVERRAEQRKALLERQWRKAVEDARTMPVTAVGGEDDAAAWEERTQAVVAGVMGLAAQMRAEPYRWAGKPGPCDEKVLRGLLVRALEAVTLELGASGRAVGEQVGVCGTTASEALRRLQRDSLLDGPAWLELVDEAAGPHSRVYRLLVDRVSPEIAPAGAESDTDPEAAEEASDPDTGADTIDDQAKYLDVDVSRSQGTPAPQGVRAKRAPVAALEVPLELSRHDLWHPQRGLGHHVCRTYAAIVTLKDPGTRLTLLALASLTGYSVHTLIKHTARMARLGLVVPGQLRDGTPTVRATARSLDAAAKQLGATGVLAARVRRHALERALWNWWCAELTWRTSSREDKKQLLGVPAEVIREYSLPDEVAQSLRWKYGRFPTTEGGRADFAAARRTVASTLNH